MTSQIERLRRSNRRLRTALVLCGVTIFSVLGFGMTQGSSEAKTQQPISITTDGTYLYMLYKHGRIDRIQIEARDDAIKQFPGRYHTRPLYEWNIFVDGH